MASEPSLSQSVDKSIDPKLTEETKHSQLHRTRELLEGGASDEDIRRAIQDCLACATQQDIIDGILPHCRATQLEFVLRETVTAGLWQVVGSLLLDERLDDAQRSRAAVEASSCADQDDFVKHVLQFCRTDNITARAVISKLIERHFWRAVAGLADCVQGTAVNWISDEALQHAGDADLAKIFQRLNCSPEQSMFWAMEAVRRRKWQAVTTIVSRFYEQNNVYYECVISETMTDAKDEDVAELAATLNIALVAATLNNEYLSNSILSECVRRRLWNSVSALLRAHSHRLSDKATRKWIIEEAIQSAEDYHLRSILPFCGHDQVDVALTEAVSRGLWDATHDLLQRNLANKNVKARALKEGIERADNLSLIVYILPNCTEVQQDSLLTETVRRGIWHAVSDILLRKGASIERQRWALEEALKSASNSTLQHILPACQDSHLEFALSEAVERGLWQGVVRLLRRGVDEKVHKWAVEQALEKAASFDLIDIAPLCLKDQTDVVLATVVKRGVWQAVSGLLKRGVSDTQLRLAVEEASKSGGGFALESILVYCPEDLLVTVFKVLFRRNLTDTYKVSDYICYHNVHSLRHKLDFLGRCVAYWLVAFLTYDDTDSCNLDLLANLVPCQAIVRYVLLACTAAVKDDWNCRCYKEQCTFLTRDWTTAFYRACYENGVVFGFDQTVFERITADFVNSRNSSLSETDSYPNIEWLTDFFCAAQSVNRAIQNAAIKRLIDFKTLNHISHISMRGVWEETRRSLFQAAVENGEWSLVMHLADHTVYDDQRGWALGETYQKQWEVFMVLADHGLTEDQLRRVHRQVAKNADWNIVLRLFERGADLRRVTEDLETANASRLRPPTKKHEEHDETGEKLYNEQMEQYLKIEREYKERVEKLKNLQKQLAKNAEDYESALEEKNLGAVLFRIKSQTDEIDINQTLNLAFSHEDAWPVVVQLVKCRMNKPQRNALFPEVIRNRMWGVARVLLERGVDLDICMDALQELKKEHQWILVARVMEYPVEDDLRRKVMKEALDNREGSVVAHIITIMEGRVTAEERETMFQQAHAQHVWQAVRRLVEEADSTGISHRDKALHTAVECYRWSEVSHCIAHGADIDRPDDEGHTMLQRAVRDGDGKKVEGLLLQGANQFVVDSEGYSLLHRAARNTSISYILVQFHGDINQPDPQGRRPLSYFIEYGNADAIECAVLWGRDVGQKVDHKGVTALHVVCKNRHANAVRYIVARGGDPLAVTDEGQSILLSAVSSPRNAETVAECIKLGISTHQPCVSDLWNTRNILSSQDINLQRVSPFYVAVVNHEKQNLVRVLYEVGACSQEELNVMFKLWSSYVERREYITQFATTPRSLKSLCRLVISHHVGVWKPRVRRRRVEQLPFLDPKMKRYVLFDDEIALLEQKHN